MDASAAVFALLGDGDARRRLSVEQLAAPHLIDSEVASALRAQVKRKAITASQGQGALETWTRLGLERYAATGLLDRVWTLRDNLTTYDATYVALAEALECSLLSGDARLGAAPGPTCVISIVRR